MVLPQSERMSEFDLLSIAADGMQVQRTVLDVAARNVAAAQASTPEHPYRRLIARFASPADAEADGIGDPDIPSDDPEEGGTRFLGAVPSREDADALTEMVAVLDAQRAYEANASIFDVGKRLAERTLQVGGT
jgi:flagellar basal-body rod protein FlgC